MINIVQWIVMGFGMMLALAGLLLFVFRKEEGNNRVKVLGQEVELSKPALVILICGCAMVIAAFWLPGKKPALVEQAGTELYQAIDKQAYEIRLLAKPVKISHDECISRGREALNRSGFTGIETAVDVAYGMHGSTRQSYGAIHPMTW